VVDEQHRFGVEQRTRCAAATVARHHPQPARDDRDAAIPRTVAMTVYGDLEISALRELPLGARRSPPR